MKHLQVIDYTSCEALKWLSSAINTSFTALQVTLAEVLRPQISCFKMLFLCLSLLEMRLGAFVEQQFVHRDFLRLADEYMIKGLSQPKREAKTFLRFPQAFRKRINIHMLMIFHILFPRSSLMVLLLDP